MGFAITWCAVEEECADRFLRQLGLSYTGAIEEIPESAISTARLDTGWRVVWCNEYGCPFLKPQDLRERSKEQDVLLCLVEEHVMASSSEMWSAGERVWWVSHAGEDGPKGLSTHGVLPPSFAAIREEMDRAQIAAGGDEADVDYIFEIPLKLAENLIGFKHDEDYNHVLDGQFHVLSRNASMRGDPSRGLLRRLFGK
jgi:hypothetical protein